MSNEEDWCALTLRERFSFRIYAGLGECHRSRRLRVRIRSGG